jgi:hypothetical protein
MTDTALRYHGEEYTAQVVAAAKIIRDALGDTAFDVGTNALITVLAECGKHSDLSEQEFLIMMVAQTRHLMDNMTIIEHPIQ